MHLQQKLTHFYRLGEEQKAIDIYQNLLKNVSPGNLDEKQSILKDMADIFKKMGGAYTGGSFGFNPLQQHIGLGKATSIEKIEITWPVTGKVQMFQNPPVDTNIRIKEDNNKFIYYRLTRLNFIFEKHGLIACSPK